MYVRFTTWIAEYSVYTVFGKERHITHFGSKEKCCLFWLWPFLRFYEKVPPILFNNNIDLQHC